MSPTVRRLRHARFLAGLVALALVTAAGTLVAVVLAGVAGPWSATLVGSGSMTPALRPGDVVLVSHVPARMRPRVGWVVLVDSPEHSRPLLHRLARTPADGHLITKGDANPTPDSTPITARQIRGVGRVLVPAVGRPALWLEDGEVGKVALFLVAAVLALWLARYGWSPHLDPWRPRAVRPRRRLPRSAAVACATGLALAVATMGVALVRGDAAFAATTANSGNQLLSGQAAPVTSLTSTKQCGAGASAPVVGYSTSFTELFSSLVLTVPNAGTAGAPVAGDLLIAQVVEQSSVTAAPSGWSVLRTNTQSGMHATLYQRIATSADAGSAYTWSLGSDAGSGALMVVTGARGLVALADSDAQGKPTQSGILMPSETVSTTNSLLVGFAAIAQPSATFSTPSGMTAQTAVSGQKGTSNAVFSEVRTGTGPTGNRTTNASVSGPNIGQTVLVVPPGGATQVVLGWTPSATTTASGYLVSRDGGTATSVTPRSATGWTDDGVSNGSHTWSVVTVLGNWRSTAATTTLNVAC